MIMNSKREQKCMGTDGYLATAGKYFIKTLHTTVGLMTW